MFFWSRGAVANGGISYVDRGSAATVDFTTSDFTKDGNYHDLDLSALVPVGATFAYLSVTAQPDAGGAVIIQAKGYAGHYNAIRLNGQSGQTDNAIGFVKLDENRLIEYYVGPIAWSVIDVTVCGWII